MARYTVNFSTNASQITRELNLLQQQVTKFVERGRRVDLTLGSLKLPSAKQLDRELQRLERNAARISPNTSDWIDLQRQIARVQLETKKTADTAKTIRLSENLGAFSPYSLNALETRLEILRIKAKDISPSAQEWRQVNREIQKTETAIEKINRKPLTMGQRAGAAGGAFLYGGGLGGGIGSALGGIAGGLAGGVPGAFTGAAIGQAVDNLGQYAAGIARVVAETNKAKIALAGVSDDQKDYSAALKAATDAGQKYLLPLSESARQFAKLQASVRGAGFDTNVTTTAFNGIASAIVATGGSAQDLSAALTATSQVFSKGKVSAEELRQQIGERLPGAFTVFAQSIGKTPQEVDKLLQEGKIGLQDFIVFLEDLGKRYGSTAEILAKAPENAGPRLQVALNAMALAYGGLFQRVGAGFQSYAADIANFLLINQNAIKTTIAEFMVFGQDLYNIFDRIIKAITPLFGNFFSYIFTNFAKGVNALARLAEESEAVAGTPEQRAQRTVELLYPDLGERALKGAPALQQALKVERTRQQGIEARTKSRQQRISEMSKTLFSDFVPSSFGTGLGKPVEGAADGGASSLKKANNELKQYVGDRIAILQSRQRAETAAIEANLLLSERDRAIQKADIAFKYANLIAEEKLRVAERDSLQYRIEDREKFLAEQKQLIDIEKQTARSQFQRDIAGGLIGQNEALKNSYEELLIRLDAIKAGRGEVTEAAKAEAEIARALNGLTKEQADGLQPVIDQTRQYANEVDKLNKLMQEQVAIQEKQASLRRIEADLTGQIQAATPLGGRGLSFGFIGAAGERAAETFDLAIGAGKTEEQAKADAQYFGQLQNQLTLLESRNNAIKSSITGIGDAFATAMTAGVASLIDGTASAEEVFSNFLKSVGQTLLQAAQQMIATYIAIGIARIFAGLGGGGGEKGLNLTDIKKYSTEGPISAGMFSGFANGGIAPGGFKAFANGGIATSPTLGLIGEGRYNEAIVPLPDGKSIPVMMRGEQPSSRDLIGGGSMNQAMAPILNMSFESTTINGVEYVSREQLEQAMMDTRKAAAREGATRGATLAIDKLQQSPSTRRRIGLS